jgi:hypothetical protein
VKAIAAFVLDQKEQERLRDLFKSRTVFFEFALLE